MRLKLYILFSLLVGSHCALWAQSYNTEWVLGGGLYYKFRIGESGLYRLEDGLLSSLGLGSVSRSDFQLWRNGREVALYEGSGYLEFWGEQNDGLADASFFQSSSQHLDKRKSFYTDSATYFLTVKSDGASNLRFQTASNEVGRRSVEAAEPYFMDKRYVNHYNTFNNGLYSRYISLPVYDSRYFYKSFGQEIVPGSPFTVNFSNLYAYSGNVPAKLIVNLCGLSYAGGERSVLISGGGSELLRGSLKDLNAGTFSTAISLSGDYSISIRNQPSTTNANHASDRIMLNYASLEYARRFDFGGMNRYAFTLSASGTPKYVEIRNFNSNGSVPILYDLTNNKRYSAVESNGVLQFYLPGSSTSTDYALVGQSGSSYRSITAASVSERRLPDLLQPSNQAEYVIISHKNLFGEGNPVEQYATYRRSAEGGAYKTKVYDIEDLEDLFAFGIKGHALSVKNFIRYARASFSVKPEHVLLIGRGLAFHEHRRNQSNALYQEINLVPTYGYPGSDILLASGGLDPVPLVNIGRISAVQPSEVKNYLEKLIQYESLQRSTSNTISDQSRLKNIVLASGGNNIYENNLFNSYLNSYRRVLEDTLYGGRSFSFEKSNSGSVSGPQSNVGIGDLLSQGVNLIAYFGHGASTTLGYTELSSPLPYNFNGKYPVFVTSGCDVGDYFTYLSGRKSNLNNIPESYLFTPGKGTVGFIAQSHLGVTSYLHKYNETFYGNLSVKNYDLPVFRSMRDGSASMLSEAGRVGSDSIVWLAHGQQTNLLGDPVLRINSYRQPDFAIAENLIVVPSNISYTSGRIGAKAYVYNLGRATGDSVSVKVTRKLPGGTVETLLSKNIKSVRNTDSLSFDIPVEMDNRYVGVNEITVSIDTENRYAELSESNNTAVKRLTIFSDGITPVSPYNYAIIDNSTSKLYASTSDPLAKERSYVLELDTTELFNSSWKIEKRLRSKGGVLAFDPGISYSNNQVYYWRVSPVPSGGATDYRWSSSSFQYISGKGEGLGQSDLYQHLKSDFSGLSLDSNSRKWTFGEIEVPVLIAHAVMGTSNNPNIGSFNVEVNNAGVASYYCPTVGNSIAFNILTEGLVPVINQSIPSTVADGTQRPGVGNGFMGSTSACGATPYSYDVNAASLRNRSTYQFSYNSKEQRDRIAQFIDWIPDNYYVIARLIITVPFSNVPLIEQWKSDGENSLYEKLISQGLSSIEGFSAPKAGVFVFKKNNKSFVPFQELTVDAFGKIQRNISLNSRDTLGSVRSVKFGPSGGWKTLEWSGHGDESGSKEEVDLEIIGYDSQGSATTLAELGGTQKSYDLSHISSAQYPYLQLNLRSKDKIQNTPYQLDYWHLFYDPLPEGAVAANETQFMEKDTVPVGEDIKLNIPFRNVSSKGFTAGLPVSIKVTDEKNDVHYFPVKNLKALNSEEIEVLSVAIPTQSAGKNLSGLNRIEVVINKDKAVPEQYSFNNIIVSNVYVQNLSLPVKIIDFSGIAKENEVHLSWTVGQEINVKQYILYKSVDGTNYSAIDSIPASGKLTYIAIDNNKLYTANYYRLVVADHDGSRFASNVIVVQPEYSASTKIYPNPAHAFIYIESGERNEKINVAVYDLSGRKVIVQNALGMSKGRAKLDISRLLKGAYFISIITDSGHLNTFKFIKE